MARKSYTPAERALHLLGALAGKSRQEINDAIIMGDASKMVPVHRQKEIPQGSLDMLKQGYVPKFTGGPEMETGDWQVLWDHCVSSKRVGDL